MLGARKGKKIEAVEADRSQPDVNLPHQANRIRSARRAKDLAGAWEGGRGRCRQRFRRSEAIYGGLLAGLILGGLGLVRCVPQASNFGRKAMADFASAASRRGPVGAGKPPGLRGSSKLSREREDLAASRDRTSGRQVQLADLASFCYCMRIPPGGSSDQSSTKGNHDD